MRYLGLDLGQKKLGVAIYKSGVIASFYDSLRISSEKEMLDKVLEIIEKEKVDKVVIGYPKNMDNSEGFRAKETEDFKKELEKHFSNEIILEDERLTTKISENILIEGNMSRKKRKTVIDGVSAVLILQSYLDRKEK